MRYKSFRTHYKIISICIFLAAVYWYWRLSRRWPAIHCTAVGHERPAAVAGRSSSREWPGLDRRRWLDSRASLALIGWQPGWRCPTTPSEELHTRTHRSNVTWTSLSQTDQHQQQYCPPSYSLLASWMTQRQLSFLFFRFPIYNLVCGQEVSV